MQTDTRPTPEQAAAALVKIEPMGDRHVVILEANGSRTCAEGAGEGLTREEADSSATMWRDTIRDVIAADRASLVAPVIPEYILAALETTPEKGARDMADVVREALGRKPTAEDRAGAAALLVATAAKLTEAT
jgi:hypothetical protein